MTRISEISASLTAVEADFENRESGDIMLILVDPTVAPPGLLLTGTISGAAPLPVGSAPSPPFT